MNPEMVGPIVVVMIVAVAGVLLPVARAIGRRLETARPRRALPTDAEMRLERIENAIEAMAVEVERIAEGQRFTTKLLAERAGGPATDVAPAVGAAMSDTKE